MFKKTTLIAALAITPLLGASLVLANSPADAPAIEEDPTVTAGTVVNVDHDNWRFTIEVAPFEQTEVAWNEDTAFSLDGQPSDADAVLQIENMVTVEHNEGLAVAVRALSEEELPE